MDAACAGRRDLCGMGRLPVRSGAAMKKRPLSERFWEKVATREDDACWNWTAFRNPKGYGLAHVAVGRSMVHAHRVAWELVNGPVQHGLVVCHRCDNPTCCNPSHLFLGSQADNVHDMVSKCRQRSGARPGRQTSASKLTADMVEQIRARGQDGQRQREIAARFGVSQTTVSDVLRRRTWNT
jgi:predicted XRE-type DNA-binding protein